VYFHSVFHSARRSGCRPEQEAIALKFLEKVQSLDFAAVIELKDVVPFLESIGMFEAIVQLCEAKADALVRPPHWLWSVYLSWVLPVKEHLAEGLWACAPPQA
jgi:hypothetical protein